MSVPFYRLVHTMVHFVTIPSLLTRSPTVPRFRHFFNLYISLKCNINIKRNNSNSRSAGSRVCQFHTCQTFQNIQKISVGKVITKTEYLTSGECLSTLVPLLSGQVACPSSKILEISSYKVTENIQNWQNFFGLCLGSKLGLGFPWVNI